MSNLSPPPLREKHPVRQDQGESSPIIGYMTFTWPMQKWLSDIKELLSPISAGGSLLWASISKSGSKLTDIETRDHASLQHINTATYTHLTLTQATDLTDGGDSALHYHATDRDSANFTGTDWTDLIDAGATTLHKHDHGGQDGLGDDDHSQYVLVTNLEADRATIVTSWDDLTDAGDSTLHYHATDRDLSNATGQLSFDHLATIKAFAAAQG